MTSWMNEFTRVFCLVWEKLLIHFEVKILKFHEKLQKACNLKKQMVCVLKQTTTEWQNSLNCFMGPRIVYCVIVTLGGQVAGLNRGNTLHAQFLTKKLLFWKVKMNHKKSCVEIPTVFFRRSQLTTDKLEDNLGIRNIILIWFWSSNKNTFSFLNSKL